MNKLLAILLVFGLVLSGCTSTMESYSVVDPAVGCWHASVFDLSVYLVLDADHTYYDSSPLGGTSGKWERDGDYIQLMKFKPSINGYINISKYLYHAETDTLYANDVPLNRVDCSSMR